MVHIAIVEDNEAIIYIISELINRLNIKEFQIAGYTRGKEFLEHCDIYGIQDIIIIDPEIPDFWMTDLVPYLKAIDPRVFVIFLNYCLKPVFTPTWTRPDGCLEKINLEEGFNELMGRACRAVLEK